MVARMQQATTSVDSDTVYPTWAMVFSAGKYSCKATSFLYNQRRKHL
jgi:hypothetical protein